jgi:hypothetical protein
MRIALAGIVGLVALLGAPVGARAQDADSVQWSATIAGAIGSGRLTCGECTGGRQTGAGGYLRIGRPIAAGLTLSGELNVWRTSEEWAIVLENGTSRGTSHFTVGTLNALLQLYPTPGSGFFLEAGLGVGRYSVSSKSTDLGGFRAYSNAVGYQAGGGYDIPVSEHVAITPSVKVFGFVGATVDGVEGKAGANVAQLGLGLTLR